MSITLIIQILGAVNTLLNIAKSAPAVLKEMPHIQEQARGILADLAAHADQMNEDVLKQFQELRARADVGALMAANGIKPTT